MLHETAPASRERVRVRLRGRRLHARWSDRVSGLRPPDIGGYLGAAPLSASGRGARRPPTPQRGRAALEQLAPTTPCSCGEMTLTEGRAALIKPARAIQELARLSGVGLGRVKWGG